MAVTKYVRKIQYASTKTVLKQIESWEASKDTASTVVRCRSWNHKWDAHTVLSNGKANVKVNVQQCDRCGGFRHRPENTSNGAALASWRHDMPKGYYMPKGAGRVCGPAMNPVRKAALDSVAVTVVPSGEDLYAQLRLIVRGDES